VLTEEQLFVRFKGKTVLLDSNLLLVLMAGALGAQIFTRFKRVSDYTIKDYELLVRLVRSFSVLLTTPHILTEVSNLANGLPSWCKSDWSANFASLFVSNRGSIQVRECWTPAAELARMPEFFAFGIADCAIAGQSNQALIVTEDYRLSGKLRSRNVPVVNFRDIRNHQRLYRS